MKEPRMTPKTCEHCDHISPVFITLFGRNFYSCSHPDAEEIHYHTYADERPDNCPKGENS